MVVFVVGVKLSLGVMDNTADKIVMCKWLGNIIHRSTLLAFGKVLQGWASGNKDDGGIARDMPLLQLGTKYKTAAVWQCNV